MGILFMAYYHIPDNKTQLNLKDLEAKFIIIQNGEGSSYQANGGLIRCFLNILFTLNGKLMSNEMVAHKSIEILIYLLE